MTNECHVQNGEHCFSDLIVICLTLYCTLFPVWFRPERAPPSPAPQLPAVRQVPEGTVPQIHRRVLRQCQGYEVPIPNAFHFPHHSFLHKPQTTVQSHPQAVTCIWTSLRQAEIYLTDLIRRTQKVRTYELSYLGYIIGNMRSVDNTLISEIPYTRITKAITTRWLGDLQPLPLTKGSNNNGGNTFARIY